MKTKHLCLVCVNPAITFLCGFDLPSICVINVTNWLIQFWISSFNFVNYSLYWLFWYGKTKLTYLIRLMNSQWYMRKNILHNPSKFYIRRNNGKADFIETRAPLLLIWFPELHVNHTFLITDDEILSSYFIYKFNFTCLLYLFEGNFYFYSLSKIFI